MEHTNPYQAPAADLSIPADGIFDETSAFSVKGRFNRLSYLAWISVFGVISWVIAFAIFGTAAAAGSIGAGGFLGFFGAQLFFLLPTTFFVIRRLHDFDSSGWWALLYFVPLINAILGLVLLLRAGDEGANRFAPPRLTRGWEKVVAYIGIGMMVLMLVGIVAAIVIPIVASR